MIPLLFLFGLSLISCAEPIKKSENDTSAVDAIDFVSDSEAGSGNSNQSPSNNNASFTQIEGAWNSPYTE